MIIKALAIAILSLVVPVFGTAEPIDLLENIANLPQIRVPIADAPGQGHQSAGITVVERLRQLGYRGKIQVIYFNGIKRKLGLLAPPFDPVGGNIQSFDNLGIEFVSYDDFAAESEFSVDAKYRNLQLPLGIMGASDWEGETAEVFNVKYLIKLQPMNWNSSKHAIKIHEKTGSRSRYSLNHLKKFGYAYSLPNPSDVAGFVESNMSNTLSLAAKISGLQTILMSKNIEIAAFYGHGANEGQPMLYAAGILWATQHAPEQFQKGVVIPVFNKLEDFSIQGMKDQLKHSQKVKGQIKIADIHDSDLADRCTSLQQGEVLIVTVGPITKPVFELFYQYSSIAPVVEGRNSMNLMHLLGRPYLASGNFESYQFKGVPPLATLAVDALNTRFIDDNEFDENLNSSQQIGLFLVEAKNPLSPTSQRFANLRIDPTDFKKDKLYLALELANKMLQKKGIVGTTLQSAHQALTSSLSVFNEACEMILNN